MGRTETGRGLSRVRRVGLVPLVLSWLGLFVGLAAAAEPPRPVEQVDLSRYMGRWYEIAVIPNVFQRHCVRNTMAEYALRDDGRVSVVNRCVRSSGEVDRAQGVARVVDPRSKARLEVSFVNLLGIQLFWGDYWVIGLGQDYEYALIGTPSRRWGWILARDPHPPEARVQAWLEEIKGQGYDPSAFVRTPQTEPDSP